jgi:hypothetical protein
MTATETKIQLDRREVEIEAAWPKNEDLYPSLLDQAVHLMTAGGIEPTSALSVAGRVVRGTPWAGFLSGKGRLASAAASYLTWLAPPSSWQAVDVPRVDGRLPVGWMSPSGELVVDLLFGAGRIPRGLVPLVKAAAPTYSVIRLLNLTAPTQSVAYLPGGAIQPLNETQWWFEGEAR